ncbi:diguanylate cyclase [Photobacterium aquae]|uniref:diguanylate cyclase n=1 Tax=Photobacterium aquae TaxID=1195763 RepID=A0A0J1H112_9GAMM|nr:response regulator [Photobacterium aquae]KLV05545.1 diguanylate cyclase [Photobacterium aquae]
MEQKILVVEDSRPFRRVIESELRKAGFTPVIAFSIAEAETILDQSTDFLCAILDYCLPDGQDGEIIDLCLAVGVKVIVLTGKMDELTRERVLAKTVIDYIPKDNPSCISNLIPILHRLATNNQHRALVVDDSVTARKYIRSLLERQYIDVIEANGVSQALSIMEHDKSITLVITDYAMPERNGVELVKTLRKQYHTGELAIIGLSASDEIALTAKFLKAGANDYLKKPFNQEEFYCRLHSTLNILDAERQLYQMANQDYLTQTWNRRYFFEHPLAKNHHMPRCLALLDIDNFKLINDTYGHHIGDLVLIELAQLLQRYFPDAIVARIGGEEFCVLYGNASQIFKQRLQALVYDIAHTELSLLGQNINFTVSLGLVHAEANIHDLLKRADNCLYKAKNDGRNCLVCEPEHH